MVERKNRNKQKRPSKNIEKQIRNKGETLTIKTDNCSYAEIVKEMKNAIKPEEIGVGIKKIRKTADGNVLIEMTKGDGQAKKLEGAIKGSLGENVNVQTFIEKYLLDIRDMEETTENDDIISGILKASAETDASKITVRNIREYYGGTKQALVEVPGNVAVTILKKNKIKVGLVICRVRRKTLPKRCFRCLEQGHLARFCRGKDRSQTCMKCGLNGHKANTCKNEPRCVICLEAGRQNISHYLGSSNTCKYKNDD